ncbi:M48 family peptidase [Arcobacter sp. HD9-500m-PIT-SAG02]|nr:M48 family peptidase [Arcobacter sp. HD9-500m-PIT-SAG02]
MQFKIAIGDNEINVLFEKKARLKHSYIKILDEKNIKIKGNFFFTKNDAKKFIHSKSQWIEKHITHLKSKKLSEDEFFYMGEKYIRRDFKEKFISLDEFYRQKAQELIPSIVKQYSEQMQLYPQSLKFRKNKSRWGSCSYTNNINLNIYLMKLPLEAIEYVVVHELAHIKHKNHSRAFWNLVGQYLPQYKNIEKLIKNY